MVKMLKMLLAMNTNLQQWISLYPSSIFPLIYTVKEITPQRPSVSRRPARPCHMPQRFGFHLPHAATFWVFLMHVAPFHASSGPLLAT